MHKPITPTLALVIAGGLAAGIALARPAIPNAAAAPTQAATQAAAERATGGGGYLGGTGPSDADAATGPSIGEAGPERSDRTVAAEAEILIRDFAFSAGTTVGTGRAITVTNVDGVAQTLTASSGLFDTGNLAGGATATLTAPGTAGTYSFFCAIHPSMRGSVTVQ